MKDRLIGFIKTYCLFVCIFVLQKPLFMLFYKSLYPDASCADWFSVIWHGLPLDLSLAGYLTAIPGFLFITSVWTLSKSLHRIWCGYFLFISVLISIIFTVDLGLYEYWGFRLDATPLFYFFSSPKDAVASVSIWMVLVAPPKKVHKCFSHMKTLELEIVQGFFFYPHYAFRYIFVKLDFANSVAFFKAFEKAINTHHTSLFFSCLTIPISGVKK